SCDIVLEGADLAPEHIRIKVTKLGIEIDELASRGMLTVNGYRAAKQFLAVGDAVALGGIVLRVAAPGAGDGEERLCVACGAQVTAIPGCQPFIDLKRGGALCSVCTRKHEGTTLDGDPQR